jgi:hypothetical protein
VTEPADLSPKPLRTWRPMALWSAAIVAALLGICFLAPFVQLHYHAWRHRTGRSPAGESLRMVAGWAVEHRAPRSRIVELLGQPDDASGEWLIYYCHVAWDGSRTPSASPPVLYGFRIEKDHVTRFEELDRWSLP